MLPEHLLLCLHVECLLGINTMLSGCWRRTWSMWLIFYYMFMVAGNSRFLQTAQPSPAAFAVCTPPPTQWPTLASRVWQSPQSAWSAQSWPCSSISSHASTVLCVKVSPFWFFFLLKFFFPVPPHSFPSWTLINQALFRHKAIVLFVSWNNLSVISAPLSYLRCPKLSMKSTECSDYLLIGTPGSFACAYRCPG